MSEDTGFPVEPWQLREVGLDVEQLKRTESLFALSNGHIGVRGTLDEGEPHGLPGTYLHSFFEAHRINYPEAGYAFPTSGQSIVNATDGKIIRLLVDDEPFDVRYGRLVGHERTLDFRAGTLRREVEWETPAGQRVRVRTTRLVSLSQRAILAVRYEVEPVGGNARVVLQSELLANEPMPGSDGHPGSTEAVPHELVASGSSVEGHRVCLLHRTEHSGLHMAAAVDHVLHAGLDPDLTVEDDLVRLTVSTKLTAGEQLTLTKFVAYGWSHERSDAALRDQTEAALTAAVKTGWDGLVAKQREHLDDFWAHADVQVDGDERVQQGVRFSLFHLLQASARAEQRAISAKGLTGTGYAGHAFWETETFVLPVLTATVPYAAADALRWRYATLDVAGKWAATLRLTGAAFAWRTIRGEECGGYWPAGTAALHVNADIAVAAARQVRWTGDADFDREIALPLLVGTARLWHGVGYLGADGRFHLDGMTGPDEYTALVDDNTYTNLAAAANLREAAAAAQRWPDAAAGLEVDAAEIAGWAEAAEQMAIAYDGTGAMPEAHRGATGEERWDFAAMDAEDYPLYRNVTYFDLYRKQVVKQADLVLALHWFGERFPPGEKAAAFAYAEELTVRDSSLSACTQAVLAAEVGHLELAHAYLREAALMDLQDIKGDTEDGLHMASLAGSWIALVCGFGGLRDHGDQLRFAPRLPPGLDRLAFALRWRGSCVRVEVLDHHARYEIVDGNEDLVVLHHGEEVTLRPGEPAERDVPELKPLTDPPTQPVGREPEPVDG